MKRDEMEKLIDETEAMFGMMTGFHPYRAVHIIRLARLGASVAEPSEEEIEAMATRLFYKAMDQSGKRSRINGIPTDIARWGRGCGTQIGAELCDKYKDLVTAAISALKDRANV